MSIFKLIKNFKKHKRILFTTPSHNQGEFVVPINKKYLGEKFFESDYSEIEGFDNLAKPDGEILEAEKKAAEIYDSKFSYFLINGSTSGILAAMLATLTQNEQVLIARNCHKSVYNGLVLTGAYPVWLMPKYNSEWGIYKPVNAQDVENALNTNPNIKAFIMTNPTYEGIISDIDRIAKICKERKVIFIVDEAHGALWNFDKTIGIPALKSNADITIQSLHKTAGAVNPSAILNLGRNSSISIEKVQDSLNLITTTSPSYPILLNIEATINFLDSKKGKKTISQLTDEILLMHKKLEKYTNIHFYDENNDITKILVKIDGLSGFQVSDLLFDKFKIEDELANEKSVMLLTGIGTTKKKIEKLTKALKRISKIAKKGKIEEENIETKEYTEPKVLFSPSKAFSQQQEEIDIKDSVGTICNELIINYPPGMPIIIPGEVIQESHLKLLKGKGKIKVITN